MARKTERNNKRSRTTIKKGRGKEVKIMKHNLNNPQNGAVTRLVIKQHFQDRSFNP